MMGPILAITFAMAIKTTQSQTVRRQELVAKGFLYGPTSMAGTVGPYRKPLATGDIVQLPKTPCFLKGETNGKKKRRLGKLVRLKDITMGDDTVDAKTRQDESKSVERGQITTWLVQTMIAGPVLVDGEERSLYSTFTNQKESSGAGEVFPEWETEWHEQWADPELLPFPESPGPGGLLEPDAVLLHPIKPGTLVPYLGHCATVRGVAKRPESKPGARGIVARSQAEAETLYEVEWSPSEPLDVGKYNESVCQTPSKDGAAREVVVVPNTKTQRSKNVSLARNALMKKGAISEVVAAIVAWLMGFGIAPLFMVRGEAEETKRGSGIVLFQFCPLCCVFVPSSSWCKTTAFVPSI
eukprot:COSAG06_NODE_1279_length_10030_cov_65.663679_2_plen_354_part_00